MAGRPKGSKDSYKRNYTVTPAALEQKRVNMANINGKSYIIDKVIQDANLSDEQQLVLKEERTQLWKKLSSPVLLLTDEYAEIKTLINLKRVKGEDVLSKDILSASKLLLEIAKEVNRLTQVSADKKLDVYAKSWNKDTEDIVINVSKEDDNRQEVR